MRDRVQRQRCFWQGFEGKHFKRPGSGPSTGSPLLAAATSVICLLPETQVGASPVWDPQVISHQ